jgi:hypothetical protein
VADVDVEQAVGVALQALGAIADRATIDRVVDEEVAGLVVERDRPERAGRAWAVEVQRVAAIAGQGLPVGVMEAGRVVGLVGVVAPDRGQRLAGVEQLPGVPECVQGAPKGIPAVVTCSTTVPTSSTRARPYTNAAG